MSGWGDLPHWEQLVGGVRGAYDNLGDDYDFAAVGRNLWDLPYQLAACAPNPGSGLVVMGPPFFDVPSAAGPPFFDVPSAAGHDWCEHLLYCFKRIVAGQYRLFLVLVFLLGCILIFYLLLMVGVGYLSIVLLAMAFDFASDNPGAAASFAVVLAAINWWRDFHRDRRQQRVEQREREQQQHGQQRDREHHQPDCQLEQRQPRKQRQPRLKQRK